MENVTLLGISAILGSGITFLFGGWTVSLTVLSIFMVIEIISWIIKNKINKEAVTSTIAFKQFYRKITIMLVVILANAMDMLVGDGTPVFKSIAVMYYTGVEGLAIKEHMKATGLSLPKQLTDKIEQLHSKEK